MTEELYERVRELAVEIEENSVFSPAQSQVVACKQLGLSHNETAEVLDKPKGTVKATWQACKTKWENAVWTVEEMGDVFQ